MIVELKTIGLEMNLQKTEMMSPRDMQITINQETLENVGGYVYLGHITKINKDNQTAEITGRIALTFAAIDNLRHISKKPKIPINLERKVWDEEDDMCKSARQNKK
ncbi:hypothetical protein JTB14_031469 [Gonioctena quinquepunctata]|nr:hypothetical protein JTB14_031469 [Gonioctena quinquepunctata]